MSNNFFNNDHSDPWDREIYQTGDTQPPKNHSGLVAVLLVAVIILAGISSILGIMNIRLFKQINNQTDSSVSLSLQTDSNGSDPSIASTAPSVPQSEVVIQFEETPNASRPNSPDSELTLQEIYVNCIDSVVSISCRTDRGSATGTGVVISEEGYIVTNCHVVEDAQSITVQLTDQRVLPASLVGADRTSDLAVLYVEAEDLIPAHFGDSDTLQVGDPVCAIGDPLGVELRGTMTDGIVSAINRDITTDGRTMTLIQTNAALNSGNSGGPLINRYGQVIGINTMKIGDYMNAAGVEGLGFAIPSSTVKTIVDQLIRQGYVSGRPSLGFTGESVSALYQYYYRLPEGLFITEVTADSDAEAKGIQHGDILLSIDGKAVTSSDALTDLLYGYEVGDHLTAIIYRDRKQYTLQLLVEEATG